MCVPLRQINPYRRMRMEILLYIVFLSANDATTDGVTSDTACKAYDEVSFLLLIGFIRDACCGDKRQHKKTLMLCSTRLRN